MTNMRSWHQQQIAIGAKSGFHSVRLAVTPELAEAILANNPDNRHLREAKIEQLTSDMKAGRFAFNGETIIIAKTGELNDGQHRLTALVKAKKAQDMVLVYGPERTTRTTVDVGAARTAGDHLSVSGWTHGATMAAVAKLVIGYENNKGEVIGRLNTISTAQIIDRLERDQLLHECAIYAGNHAKFKSYAPKSVIGFCLYAFSKKNPACAKTFLDNVKDGIGLTAESPIRTLREKLMTSPRLSQVQRIECFFRAWNAWREERPLTRISIMGRLPELES